MKLVELGEVCEIYSGATPSRKKIEYFGGNINWFTPKDLGNISSKYVKSAPEKITQKGYDSCSTHMLPPFSVLFSSRAPIGHIAINLEECCTNQGFKSLVPEKSKIDYLYLFYVLQKNIPIIKSLGRGATFKELSKSDFLKFKIPLFPLPEQKRIAHLLDQADKLRQLNKQLIAKYDELAQSVFLDMFGENKGFEQIKLGKVIKLIGGGTPSKKEENYWNGNIPWASVKDLKSDKLSETVDKITIEGVKNSSTKIIPKGSLIIATRMAVGRTAICEKDIAINQDLKGVKITGNIKNEYLQWLLKSKQNYFDYVSSGATVKGIKIEHITELKIPLPPLFLQTDFANRVALIEQQKTNVQQALQKSDDLFNALLQKVFKN